MSIADDWIAMDLAEISPAETQRLTLERSSTINDDASGDQNALQAYDVLSQVIKAVAVFIGRLWLAYIFISCLFLIAKEMTGMDGDFPSPSDRLIPSSSLSYQLTILNNGIRLMGKPIRAIPALFGKRLNSPVFAPMVSLENENACHPFQFKFPNLTRLSVPDLAWNQSILENSTRIPWIGLVRRGGCPFDTKIYELEQAGFSGAIVYNALNFGLQRDSDQPIRMATFARGNQVSIVSMFMKRQDGLVLLESLDWIVGMHQPPVIALKIAPMDWGFNMGASNIKELLRDIIFFFLDLSLFACGFLTLCFCLALLRNLVLHREWMLLETLVSGSEFLLAEDRIVYPVPSLKSIPFPKRILEAQDIEVMNSRPIEPADEPTSKVESDTCLVKRVAFSNPCCAVCIEDFEAGDTVRDLPCGHIYHDIWYVIVIHAINLFSIDQWLLKHNRLCPVCKQDVLEPTKKVDPPASQQPFRWEQVMNQTRLRTRTWLMSFRRTLQELIDARRA